MAGSEYFFSFSAIFAEYLYTLMLSFKTRPHVPGAVPVLKA